MSTLIAPSRPQVRPSRRERRAERKRLKRQADLAARLGELHSMGALLDQAETVIKGGWVQGAWFTVATSKGERPVTAYDLGMAVDREVTGACLVGAVVHAAGGPTTVRSQLVQRTLDLMWHVLHEDPDRPVRWCPGPRVRMMAVLDLTRWNDSSSRTRDEVVGLLEATRHASGVQQGLCRAEQARLEEQRVEALALR